MSKKILYIQGFTVSKKKILNEISKNDNINIYCLIGKDIEDVIRIIESLFYKDLNSNVSATSILNMDISKNTLFKIKNSDDFVKKEGIKSLTKYTLVLHLFPSLIYFLYYITHKKRKLKKYIKASIKIQSNKSEKISKDIGIIIKHKIIELKYKIRFSPYATIYLIHIKSKDYNTLIYITPHCKDLEIIRNLKSLSKFGEASKVRKENYKDISEKLKEYLNIISGYERNINVKIKTHLFKEYSNDNNSPICGLIFMRKGGKGSFKKNILTTIILENFVKNFVQKFLKEFGY